MNAAPYFGAPTAVPGNIEAENFDAGGEGLGYHDNTPGNQGDASFRSGEDVDVFTSNDGGSGSWYIVKNFESGEWLAYTISVPASGSYNIDLRASTNAYFPNPAYHIEIDGTNVTGTVVLPVTGGWNNYQWLGRRTVAVTAGTHVLKVVSEQQYFNLNTIRVTAAGAATSRAYFGTPTAVPGVFEAETFDQGGEGVAYHDNSRGNQGNAGLRDGEDVDIFVTNDASSGSPYIVKNFESGEWLSYTISVPADGNYDIDLRASTNAYFPNAAYHIEIDGTNVTGTVVLPVTGGWNNYQWLGRRTVAVTAGTHVLKVVSEQQYFNLNTIRVTAAGAATSRAYFGTPTAVPGVFEAETFDQGGEGVGYHDNSRGNQGNAGLRDGEDVDIFVTNDASSGSPYIVKNFESGEWLSYTISVPADGNYDIDLRASTNAYFPNAAYHVEVDGTNVTGTVVLPDTGGWDNYQWLGSRTVALTYGIHVLTLVSERQYFNVNSIRVSAASAVVQRVDPSTVLYWCSFVTSLEDCGFQEQSKVPGRASIVSVSREGVGGLRLHTEPGDDNVVNSGIEERDDVWLSQDATDGYEGHEAWWAHSMYLPDDFAMPTWQGYVLADFHNSAPGGGQANFHVLNNNGMLAFQGYGGVTTGNDPVNPFSASIGPIQKNVWYDFVYHVRWSSGWDGFFEAWVNGKKILSHSGPTLYAGQGVYLKLANYHVPVCDPWPDCDYSDPPSSVIHDRIVRGTTALAVSAGPLEGVLTWVDGVLTPIAQ